MTDEFLQWLREQLDDDERIAVSGESWTAFDESQQGTRRVDVDHSFERVVACTRSWRGLHIARHDPARVLREVEAKRQVLAELLPAPREPETDGELHARSAHPAYEYRTTEGPRKQWDHMDEPPADENGVPDPTWERNTDAGSDGWARFDYTEESYWRRRLPAGQERRPQVPRWLRLFALPYADRPGYRDDWRP
ncbi:DUF6221 family protein [Streptomyces anthocyanicus]|uniref:DUF6221 family protein n=1 Tax=Streptomyces anthocyanicus TaxID=68174 RepID=UPI00365A06E4